MSLRERLRKVWQLFLIFLKIGGFTFGGGYAMIPLIEYETAERRHLVEKEEISDIVAIAESTPGPIAINAATFVGYHTRGLAGAVAATLGVVLPSFGIILGLSYVLRAFQDAKIVQYAFRGIRVGVLVLLLKALWKMFMTNPKGAWAYGIMGLSFVLTAFLEINAIFVIVLCGALGVVSTLLAERRLGK